MPYTKKDCYDALREAAEQLGKSPSKSEYDSLDLRPCANVIHSRCESWNAAKEHVGLEVHQRHNTYTKQDCIDALQEAAESLGKSPSREEYDNLGLSPGSTAIDRHLGSWAEAKQEAGLEVLSPGTDREYTNQDCIDALQIAAEKLGKSPYMEEYDELHLHPKSNTIVKYFGGWDAAKREAGLETYYYTDEECLVSLKKAADIVGHSPTLDEYDSTGLKPTASAIQQRFDDWDTAKAKAGLDSRARITYSEEECLTALDEAYNRLGSSPTTREYSNLNLGPSVHAIKIVFGSWNAAKEMAGFDTTPSSHERTYTKQDCIEALEEAAKKIGTSPTIREYTALGARPSARVVKRWFGSWNDAKEEIGLEKYMDGSRSDGHYYGPDWQQIRETVMIRDEYRCLKCEIDLENHLSKYKRSFHVHHLIKFEEFEHYRVANDTSNLVTVCMGCHRKIENWALDRQCEALDVPHPDVEPSSPEQLRLNRWT